MHTFDRKFGTELLREVPSGPGIYLVHDATGTVIYVGKAKNLKRRLSQYRNASRKKRDRKMRAIVRAGARLSWIPARSHLEACLEETKQIQTHQPRFNVQGAYSFLYPFVGIQREGAVTRLVLTTKKERFGNFAFHGAFRSRDATAEGFFALYRTLRYLGPPAKKSDLGKALLEQCVAPRSYLLGVRGLPGEVDLCLESFLKGESPDLLAVLTERLLEKAGARAQAQEVELLLFTLREFWNAEPRALARARQAVGFAGYPVEQTERDPLFLRYRLGE